MTWWPQKEMWRSNDSVTPRASFSCEQSYLSGMTHMRWSDRCGDKCRKVSYEHKMDMKLPSPFNKHLQAGGLFAAFRSHVKPCHLWGCKEIGISFEEIKISQSTEFRDLLGLPLTFLHYASCSNESCIHLVAIALEEAPCEAPEYFVCQLRCTL